MKAMEFYPQEILPKFNVPVHQAGSVSGYCTDLLVSLSILEMPM